MTLGWKSRVHLVAITAMIGGASAMLPGYWLHWPSPARKALMIGVAWIVLAAGLAWAGKAADRPHQMILFRPGGLLHYSRLTRSGLALLEVVLVGAFLWVLLY
jgi:hypothetical protein